MTGRIVRTSALVALVIVVAALCAAAGYLVTRHFRSDATRATPAVTPSALAAASARPTAPATSAPATVAPAAVATALAPALQATGLGSNVLASVVDADRGTPLFERSSNATAAPASTLKITTAVAALETHAATDRITTRAVSDGQGTIVLVGGGDPTLSAAPAGQATRYAGAARLSDLAAQVTKSGATVSRVVVDDARFSGPSVSPSWASEDVPSSYGAAITAVMADGGRAAPDAANRSASPDLDAGREFATLLGAGNIPVARGTPTVGARMVGTVSSAPYATLVEQMLQQSDNVIAECLGRQIAIAARQPASFTGAAAAVRATLRAQAGVDIGGGLVDASGLAASDRISPAVLTSLLRAVAGSSTPAVRDVVTSLPVAGWSGSLAARYVSGSAAAAAGIVRAKTGTLTGVSTLAGFVHTPRGGLLAFAIFADHNDDTAAAQAALDTLVSRLAVCSC